MIRWWPGALSADKFDKIEKQIVTAAKAQRHDAVQAGLAPLLRAQRRQQTVAIRLLRITEAGHLPIEQALEVLTQVYAAHVEDQLVLGLLGEALEQARDINMLNAPPPEDPLFENVVNALSALAAQAKGSEMEERLHLGLSTAGRMLARQRDELVERSYRRLVELDPRNATRHYNLGLFFKTRGRFLDGMIANQAAANLVSEPVEAYDWNLGICATGAGRGDVALQVWKRIGQHIEMGRFGLPEGGYPQCKVRLAERPLAERSADQDDPGREETIWIERLSPCHGVIRSVLYQDLGIDYGDVILFDGAAITFHTYGEQRVPVFPHLATLIRNNYRLFAFAGTQQQAKQIAEASLELERDAIVYSHSENFVTVCANCWRDSSVDHEHKEQVTKHVITGQIAAPPDFEVGALLRQLDAAMAKLPACHLYVPELCEAAGLPDRAAVERRRFEMIARA